MRRPLAITLLALFVAWLSFGLVALALVAALPHGDFPLQPLPSLLGLAASLTGVLLAWRLWRRHPAAVRTLHWWTALVIAFAAFWPVIAAPGRERRGAVTALVLGACLLVWGAGAAGRLLRGR